MSSATHNDGRNPSNTNLLEMAEVSILLDSYDDIFSDFDPRVYAERSLSDDFLLQAKKFTRSKSGEKLVLRLLLPAENRKEADEKVIEKRLHSYFKGGHQQIEKELRKVREGAYWMTVVGVLLMSVASYLSFSSAENLFKHILLVIFEPAGWYLLWRGLDNLLYATKERKKDLDFYSKMTHAEICFFTY
jgi:hypothetical protein